MAELARPPGSFCWPELATTDQKAAVTFYRTLFGWDANEQPMGPAETYSIFQLRGKDVAAAYTLRDQERQFGVPPHWNTYVSVEDADRAAKRAQELGGKIVAPPFDVMDAGRMAVLQDPTGATFQVWQSKRHIGTRIQGEPGALCWTELATRDTRAAEAFYTQLFGWRAKRGTDGGMEYTEFSVGDRPGGGMMAMPSQVPSQVPAHWTPYFQVTDVDRTAANATSAGGKTVVPPTDIPKVGRFAMLHDPQGAMFAIFNPARG
jgi:predicted enzyme related to lactoylglutathione lyase